ncbi:glutamate--tRNA ligase [Sulfolobales archaeon HS-7]|nr:glutamate--tRNA ligase [Sulfolobales archaeon HS-7]
MEDVEKIARKYALINAIEHDGKAELNAVVSKIFAERPELRSKAKEVVNIVKKVTDTVNSIPLEEQKRVFTLEFPEEDTEKRKVEQKKELPDLPNVKDEVVTRFAPNPDGPIHLGNARSAILSFEYARIYHGKFILRFDDTDPKVKKPVKEAYQWIEEDLKWLGINWHGEPVIASRRLERYYEVTRQLIAAGQAYVDVSKDEFKRLRDGRQFPLTRSYSPESNLELWDKMLSGSYSEGEAVVRIKTDINNPDPSQIDWVMLRIVDTSKNPHPLVGSKYIIWPTYNFASPIDDHDFGVTHILRAKEHESNTKKQRWIFKYMGWEEPSVTQFGRLKLEGFMMSKSKIKSLIEKGTDRTDPRLPTIAGLRRRGILRDTIWEIIIDVGLKVSDATISFQNVAALNRKKADRIAKRLMFVKDQHPNEAPVLKYMGRPVTVKAQLNPYIEEYRVIEVNTGDLILVNKEDYEDGRKVRLMELCNGKFTKDSFICDSYSINEAKTKQLQIIQWVKKEESIEVEVILPQHDMKRIWGRGERYLGNLHTDEIIQLIRFGFSRVDQIDNEKDGHRVSLIYAHE